jgi:hypothetical protein
MGTEIIGSHMSTRNIVDEEEISDVVVMGGSQLYVERKLKIKLHRHFER